MSVLPESLRRVLEARKQIQPAPAFQKPAVQTELTTIWKNGEVWRESRGVCRLIRNANPL